MAKAIEGQYGRGGVAFVVDEGYCRVGETYGKLVADLGMAEKGLMTMIMDVK